MTDEAPIPAAPAVIEVRESAWFSQIAILGRDLMKITGAGLFVDGVISHRTIQIFIGLVLSVAPIVYAQFKHLWSHRAKVFLAKSPRVPSDLARLK